MIKPSSFRVAVLCAAAALLSLALFMPRAQSPVQTMPSYSPIGVAAAGNGSAAWFRDASIGRAVVCQAAGPGPASAGIQCMAAKLQ